MKKSKLKITRELLQDFLLLPKGCEVRGCSMTADGRDVEIVLEADESNAMPQSDNLALMYHRTEHGKVEFSGWRG